MDDIDRMLAGMQTAEPVDLPQKTVSAFRRRRRKFMIIHAAASLALISSGAWLLLPATGIITPADAFADWRRTNRFEIFPQWRHRYGPGVTHNTEHVFSLCVPAASENVPVPV